MNYLDYASLEDSNRLNEAGIVIDTDFVWRFDKSKKEYFLTNCNPMGITSDIPAPTIAAVLRELPGDSKELALLIRRYIMNIENRWNPFELHIMFVEFMRDINRLIDLLIWARKGKQHTKVFNAINATSGITKVTP
jgi:hypothetical protein